MTHHKHCRARNAYGTLPDHLSTDDEGRVTAVDFQQGACYTQELVTKNWVPRFPTRTYYKKTKTNPQTRYEPISGAFVVVKEVTIGRYTILLKDGTLQTLTFPVNGRYRKVK